MTDHNLLPDWNDLPQECRVALCDEAEFHVHGSAGQCALGIYNKLRELLPPQPFPLFDELRTAATHTEQPMSARYSAPLARGSEPSVADWQWRVRLGDVWSKWHYSEGRAQSDYRAVYSNAIKGGKVEVRNLYAAPPAEGSSGNVGLIEAFARLQRRLMSYCNHANAGHMPSDAREFGRRILLGFQTAYEEAGVTAPTIEPETRAEYMDALGRSSADESGDKRCPHCGEIGDHDGYCGVC